MRTRPDNSGHMIVPTMIIVLLLSTLVGVAVLFTQHAGRLARDSRELTNAISIADGELDRMYDQWKRTVKSLPLGQRAAQADLDAISQPIPVPTSVHPGFAGAIFPSTFQGQPTHTLTEVDSFGVAVPSGTAVTSMGSLPGFNGMYSINTMYEARVAVGMPSISHTPTVEIRRTFTRSDAPIFQTAIFFENDLELHPGETMVINGPVVTNHHLYASGMVGKGLTFQSYVSYNKNYGYTEQPPAATGYAMGNWQPPTYAGSKSSQLSKAKSRFEPAGKDMRNEFNTGDANPNNDSYRELLQRADGGYSDPPTIARYRFYNQASLKISVTQTQVAGNPPVQTVTVLGHDNNPVDPAVAAKVVDAIGIRAPMYDRREQQNVSVTPVDVSKFAAAVLLMNGAASPANRFNGIVYFSDTSPDATKRAFRLENGVKLPTYDQPVDSPPDVRGFSVATDAGIYIKGDYNSYSGTPAVPSAVMADAVMILSNAWSDTNAGNPLHGVDNPLDPSTILPGTARTASATTVETSIMAGTIPTGYVNSGTGVTYGPSGGAHNFPRFLENWTGVPFTFKGSMVQLFTSTIFTGPWSTGAIYSPPNRIWSANPDFAKHPCPGLFCVTTYSRGTWRRF